MVWKFCSLINLNHMIIAKFCETPIKWKQWRVWCCWSGFVISMTCVILRYSFSNMVVWKIQWVNFWFLLCSEKWTEMNILCLVQVFSAHLTCELVLWKHFGPKCHTRDLCRHLQGHCEFSPVLVILMACGKTIHWQIFWSIQLCRRALLYSCSAVERRVLGLRWGWHSWSSSSVPGAAAVPLCACEWVISPLFFSAVSSANWMIPWSVRGVWYCIWIKYQLQGPWILWCQYKTATCNMRYQV